MFGAGGNATWEMKTDLQMAMARVIRNAQYWRQKKKDMLGATEQYQKTQRKLLHQAERELGEAVDSMDRLSGI